MVAVLPVCSNPGRPAHHAVSGCHQAFSVLWILLGACHMCSVLQSSGLKDIPAECSGETEKEEPQSHQPSE